MAKIIQSPRRIQSPGVQITETDLTRKPTTQSRIKPGVLVTGFTPYGPTDQLVKITSTRQFESIYGIPETAAERYLFHTVDQTSKTGSDVYVSRLPYGEGGGGQSVQNYYSALLFPVLAHGENFQTAESFYVLPPSSFLISEQQYEKYIKKGSVEWKEKISSVNKVSKNITIDNSVIKSIFIDICNDLKVTDIDTVSNWYGPSFTTALYAGPVKLPGSSSTVTRNLTSFNVNRAFISRLQTYIDEKVQSENTDLVYKGAPTVWANVNFDFSDIITNQEDLSALIANVNNNGILKDIPYDLSMYSNLSSGVVPSYTIPQATSVRILQDLVTEYSITNLSEVTYWLGGTKPAWFTLASTPKIGKTGKLSDINQNSLINSFTFKLNSALSTVLKTQEPDAREVGVTINTMLTNTKELSGSTSNLAPLSINYTKKALTKNNLDLDFSLNDISDIVKSGIVIVNDDKLTNNDLYEGFYIGLADNSDDTPDTDFQSVKTVYAVNSSIETGTDILGNVLVKQNVVEIPEERMAFTLTESYSSINFNSVSERMARFPSYDFSQDVFNDCLKVFLFKLNTSTNLQDSITLDYSTAEAYVGSLYSRRKQNDPRGGRLVNFCVQNKIENNSNSRIKMLLNTKISENGTWVDEYGMPTKNVRISEDTKALWPTGIHQKTTFDNSNKTIGDLILKLDRSFQLCELTQNENNNIDVVCEAGLGTINASICARPDYTYFDDTLDVNIDNLYVIPKNWKEYYQYPDVVRDGYSAVVRKFRNFAQNKKDHVFISDPLRYIFVSGRNSKTQDSKTFNFVNNILRPMNITYAKSGRSTYMAVYATWIKTYDSNSDDFTWVPPSGYMAKVMLNAKKRAPWTAPAGFSNGRLSGISDIAINPNQRQRDLLYRASYNPIVDFPREGTVVYGQKTFINYQTAFDRLNVRNLFLYLEKETTRILNRFVFEPNTITTRNRVLLRLTPLFERAKTREGLYDYRLICDERNNTPASIDNNELRVAVYIQPVRTAEFILADFVATRTGVDLDALIG